MCRRSLFIPLILGLVLVLVPCPAPACSLCGGGFLTQAPTLRQEAAQPSARLILFGPIQNARDAVSSELTIETVLRKDPVIEGKKIIDLGRYLPVSDAKNPPRFLVFCDVDKNKVDAYRGVPIGSADGLAYVKKALELDPKDPAGNLDFYFKYLENPDKVIASDAFLEFVRANDQQIGAASSKLSPEKLRGWLKDPQTPPERISLYAFLLGGCGGDADAAFLEEQLKDDSERTLNAYDGYLGGYIHLRQREGWNKALAVLSDGRKPLPMRLAAVRTVRLYHGWQPKDSREDVLKCLSGMITQGELADVAVEDLRRWQMWELTREIVVLYGKKGFDAPIIQRAIVRYALSAKDDETARKFIAERRRYEPDLVKEVEESLQFEK
jgi:hypothetical protein